MDNLTTVTLRGDAIVDAYELARAAEAESVRLISVNTGAGNTNWDARMNAEAQLGRARRLLAALKELDNDKA